MVRSVAAKTSNADEERYISSGLTDVFGFVFGAGSSYIYLRLAS